MLSIEDCIAMSDLTEAELEAIAEHEHLPMIVATELGTYLLRTQEGEHYISDMIRDDIAAAEKRGDRLHALALRLVLRHFIQQHPACLGEASRLSGANTVQDFLRKVPIMRPTTVK